MTWLEENDLISDEQNGFRKLRNCIDHIHSLYSIVQNRLLQQNETFCCFVDAQKAFDSLSRECLRYKLQSLGIQGRFYNAIKSLYTDVKFSVRVNGTLSEWFDAPGGVKQGCLLSPALFSIYVNNLADEFNELGHGVDCGDRNVSLLMYADDLVLIAPSAAKLQLMLDHLHTWCHKWRMRLNKDKTKIIHFRRKNTPKTAHMFTCGELDIKLTEKYKYLGLWFQEHLDLNVMVKLVSQAATRALGKMITKFKQCGQHVYSCYKKLYDSCVLPVILYGAGIWGYKEFPIVNTVQNKASRFFLGVPAQSPNVGTQGEMGWASLSVATKVEMVRLWCRLKRTSNNRLTKHIFEWSSSLAAEGRRNWNFMVTKLFEDLNLRHLQDNFELYTSRFIVNTVQEKLNVCDVEKWHHNLWNDVNKPNGNKLRTYRKFKSELVAEPYLLLNQNTYQRRSLSKLRIGVLPLEIETGRHTRPSVPLNERICTLCNLNVCETECHFMLECPLYDDQRQPLLERVLNIEPLFNSLNMEEQLVYLMSHEHIQGCLIKTVHNMFYRRQIFTTK